MMAAQSEKKRFVELAAGKKLIADVDQYCLLLVNPEGYITVSEAIHVDISKQFGRRLSDKTAPYYTSLQAGPLGAIITWDPLQIKAEYEL